MKPIGLGVTQEAHSGRRVVELCCDGSAEQVVLAMQDVDDPGAPA